MPIPEATAYRADKRFADEKFYSIDGFDGFFRRLRKEEPGWVLATVNVDGLAQQFRFLEVFASELEDAKKPSHAPGPNVKTESAA